ncbi:MAG TPA: multifunctional oxoglutarate decarboxylase/oxoglutarate dehydrogenase thiamine pyrophosphate-binding subunit/dihydrolipoyllysine-residue succinyltransferase subunit [Euzebyales bacterium]|nr:multifunctional oxoglutarate decarboxylase/oxoglutarate dehydrogenase thiamine pyrophosphate-binding subunit/dihydrolipoyllysine-residue succinyltransferase subunit [Euzebyales bacterium]
MSDRQQFGANLWLVDEMYQEYLKHPDAVSETWQEFFSDYRPAWDPGNGDRARPAAEPAGGRASHANGSSGTTTARREPDRQGTTRRQDGERSTDEVPDDAKPLRGVAATIAENMDASLGVPTATSIRVVPAKLLEVNRKILNNQLRRTRGGKVSFTHLIGWAMVRAMQRVPAMTSQYVEDADGKGYLRRPDAINLGLAMDLERKDGSRTLLVPNIKDAGSLDFGGFFRAYEEVVRKVRRNDLSPELFAGTSATLTNPGTVGTAGSVPRLMPGQSMIMGVGAIGYPAEYKAADPRSLAEIGVGKVITLTSTYDHRVIQGAESGMFLALIEQMLLGEEDFYDDIFNSLRIPYEPARWRTDDNPRVAGRTGDNLGAKQIAVQQLINMYRVRGHLIANLNPLMHDFQRLHPELDPLTYGLTIWDLDREFLTGTLSDEPVMPLGQLLGMLRDAYCRTVGIEYMHIQEPEQKAWIQERVEGVTNELDVAEQRHILGRLNAAEAFEKFLHTKFLGQKRFSLEGAESTIPMLDAVLSAAADAGIRNAVMGMAHRGRLNVLASILGKSYEKIFTEFEGHLDPDSVQGSGDVKYHMGASGRHTSPDGKVIDVFLSGNPSHLEAVDPVVVGMARARLDQIDHSNEDFPVLPILVHGDAAFAGGGVVFETMSMSQLRGYRVGGTVHLIVNNQLGFTTAPHQSRSSQYATDVAKTVQAPIFHVNGDDPEACVRVMQLAFAFRQAFAKDVVVDMICYRRHGHNEGDEPSYTQPIMYAAIEGRRSVRKLYTEELVTRGDLTVDEAEEALEDFRRQLDTALDETRETSPPDPTVSLEARSEGVLPHVETGVDRERLDEIAAAVTSWPEDFTVHPKLGRQLEKRRDLLDRDTVDWAMAEALAFGSLLLEGTPIRMAGQDSRRGTFSQRHAVLVDYRTGEEHVPLENLSERQAKFKIYDSPLNEFATVGFEYGYSVARKDALVIWEAQFGDFVNGAQVIIDQFITAANDKWGQTSGLVMFLPHGYEGQGPEHSSGRIERFLQAAAEDNIQVAQPSTAAQFFHLLRRQMHRDIRRPLIVFTPKGMLRAKPALSAAKDFMSGTFQEVLDDVDAPEQVRRVVLASGKLAHQLRAERTSRQVPAAVVRVEQLYPWPGEHIREIIERYGDATEVFWVQDEPENMGAWPFAHQRLHRLLRDDYTLRHISRGASASPASGSAQVHKQEEQLLVDGAFDGLG